MEATQYFDGILTPLVRKGFLGNPENKILENGDLIIETANAYSNCWGNIKRERDRSHGFSDQEVNSYLKKLQSQVEKTSRRGFGKKRRAHRAAYKKMREVFGRRAKKVFGNLRNSYNLARHGEYNLKNPMPHITESLNANLYGK